jgi:hypothetical protein
MRHVLYYEDLVDVQLGVLKNWIDWVGVRGPMQPFHPHHSRYLQQMKYFQLIADRHQEHLKELQCFKIEYVEQIPMWGFERAKAESERDANFIERRRLHIATLNSKVKKMAKNLEE